MLKRQNSGGPFPERPSLLSIPFVFFPGGDPAADMALGLVFVEYLLDLPVQPPVDDGQAFAQVLMYGRFADPEPAGGGADSGFVLDDVQGQLLRALLHVTLH